jgi:signal transduction histidine kinase
VAVFAQTQAPLSGARTPSAGRARLEQRIRALPIRWRIGAIAALNTAVVLLLMALIWDGAQVITGSWQELRQARQSDRLLVLLESEAVRLQNLIHRYFNQPQPNLLAEIERRRSRLLAMLKTRAANEPAFSTSVGSLVEATERFLAGFDQLREVRATISNTYEHEVVRAARDMSGLYSTIETATKNRDAPIWPALSKSREAFSATLVAANAYYLSIASDAAEEAYRSLDTIERTLPAMLELTDNDQQRNALAALRQRATLLRSALNNLTENFATQSRLLRESIDGNQASMLGAIERMAAAVRAREEQSQAHFDQALNDVYFQVALVALAFLILIVAVGFAIAGSISGPLGELKTAMHAIVAGDYDRRVRGTEARDEIGEMARAAEVFRENAVARRRAEDELRASKERAENTLADLRDTQQSLIQAEKLAALGGLVAGVAHEVNNPVGISLTVASSLAQRCAAFATEIAGGQLRRSRLEEFVAGAREAANQLVSNLDRAGDLIQSFKQVAVDRSHEERRHFDLKESTDQIVASLRPGLKRAQIELVTDVGEFIQLDSFPGAYGQVITNLALNAVTHGFGHNPSGTIRITARRSGAAHVEIVFSDDGTGMSEEVQRRAFDPFFTTRRSHGGTGLGLHIVYNIVTRRLGGRIALNSAPGRGTTFRIMLPLVAPRQEPVIADIMTVTDR